MLKVNSASLTIRPFRRYPTSIHLYNPNTLCRAALVREILPPCKSRSGIESLSTDSSDDKLFPSRNETPPSSLPCDLATTCRTQRQPRASLYLDRYWQRVPRDARTPTVELSPPLRVAKQRYSEFSRGWISRILYFVGFCSSDAMGDFSIPEVNTATASAPLHHAWLDFKPVQYRLEGSAAHSQQFGEFAGIHQRLNRFCFLRQVRIGSSHAKTWLSLMLSCAAPSRSTSIANLQVDAQLEQAQIGPSHLNSCCLRNRSIRRLQNGDIIGRVMPVAPAMDARLLSHREGT